jgi:segregation and condensation protein A
MTESSTFHIKTDQFEGPLELLLELVEKRKLLINDISLATVTDEYMQMVSVMQERSLPHTAQFIALAATLLLIKSKSLLPVLELTEEEHEQIDDLESQLRYYQIFRDAGQQIQQSFGKTVLVERRFVPGPPLFHPDNHCTIPTLKSALHNVLEELPTTDTKPQVQIEPTVTLEEMIEKLSQRIATEFQTTFSTLRAETPERKTVAVSFLAVLELYKQGHVTAHQVEQFGEIEIAGKSVVTPSYY